MRVSAHSLQGVTQKYHSLQKLHRCMKFARVKKYTVIEEQSQVSVEMLIVHVLTELIFSSLDAQNVIHYG